jgi:hypothetical protein
MTVDIQIGLLDLDHYAKTKEVKYMYGTICRENVEDVLAGWPRWDWYAEEKYIVKDLMLAGF